jgi:hypothetical protein
MRQSEEGVLDRGKVVADTRVQLAFYYDLHEI